MYRTATPTSEPRLPWLFSRPERSAAVAFMTGTLASAAALGVAASSAEGQGYTTADLLSQSTFPGFAVLTVAVSVVVWGLVVRLALSLRRGLDTGLVVAAVVAMTLLSIFEAMISAGRHGQSTLLQSSRGRRGPLRTGPARLEGFDLGAVYLTE
jgi:hypothetical protein